MLEVTPGGRYYPSVVVGVFLAFEPYVVVELSVVFGGFLEDVFDVSDCERGYTSSGVFLEVVLELLWFVGVYGDLVVVVGVDVNGWVDWM